jgi:hypothetical protein
MKNLTNLAPILVVFFASLFSSFSIYAQNVYFADTDFKTVLLANPLVNSNGDNEIQKIEATTFSGSLNISNAGIYDLTGIEHFTSMVSLNVSNNQLSWIELYANNSLVSLDCSNNSLKELNIDNLTELRSLNISNNKLKEINLVHNHSIKRFHCSENVIEVLNLEENIELLGLNCRSNALTSLDISSNSNLLVLDCSNNQLASLNMANNNNINIASSSFDATNNALNCIKVDDKNFSDQNWASKIDAGSFFSNSCITSLPTKDVFTGGITVFPNPISKVVTITFGGNTTNVSLKIFNSAGKVVLQDNYQDRKSVTLDLDLSAGIYMVAIDKGTGEIETQKLIKQ